jgi:DNA-binding NtrC family response regulator
LKINWKGLLPISGKVIVIEDDQTLRLLMADILREIGAQSLAFETADDALTYLLEAHTPCPLVVVDHALPGQIQGAEFIEMVKGKWPTTGSILISGYLLDPLQYPAGLNTCRSLGPWMISL